MRLGYGKVVVVKHRRGIFATELTTAATTMMMTRRCHGLVPSLCLSLRIDQIVGSGRPEDWRIRDSHHDFHWQDMRLRKQVRFVSAGETEGGMLQSAWRAHKGWRSLTFRRT